MVGRYFQRNFFEKETENREALQRIAEPKLLLLRDLP